MDSLQDRDIMDKTESMAEKDKIDSSSSSSGRRPSSPLSSLNDSSPPRPDFLDPAGRYPSPMSTVASAAQSSPRCSARTILGEPADDDVQSQLTVEDGPPTPTPISIPIPIPIPAAAAAAAPIAGPLPTRPRKRKAAQPKTRTTEYLDLTKTDAEVNAQDRVQMERLTTLLHKKKKIVVIAGAGISVSSGIPDFRSPTGLFARAKSQHNLKGSGTQLFDASVYKHNSSTEHFHTMVREMAEMSKEAQPTPFHHMLASLSQEGRLLRLYSQNIDCLDTNMKPLETKVPLPSKGPWPTTIQLHGGLQKMVCSKCHQLEPFQSELFNGPEPPLCETCKIDDQVRTVHAGKRSHGIGRLRPRFVLYNEFNPDGEAIGNVSAADLKTRPDAVIVVGTTLKVPGTRRLAKEMCQVTRGRRDGLTVWINLDPEPKNPDLKDCWDIVVRAKCDDVARLAALPSWDCDIGNDYLVSKDDDSGSKSKIEIAFPSSPRKAAPSFDAPGVIPTPHPSPKPTAKKQLKISFVQKAETDETAPKVDKKSARKPKQPRKPRQPRQPTKSKTTKSKATPKASTIQTFATVTKNVPIDADVKPLAHELDISCRKRPIEDSASPEENAMRKRQMTETISPKTKPRGLQQLID